MHFIESPVVGGQLGTSLGINEANILSHLASDLFFCSLEGKED